MSGRYLVMAACLLKLNPYTTELLYIHGVEFPCQDRMISWENSWIILYVNKHNLVIVLDIQLCISPCTASLSQSCRFLFTT